MSISEIQKRNILEEVTRMYHATGERPGISDILNDVSKFFSNNPIGTPLAMPLDFAVEEMVSNVDKMNDAMLTAALNLEVLYQASDEQVDDIMELTTMLRTSLERLKIRRNKLITKIDDYLFSLYNSDGYYFSVSDSFNDLSAVDPTLTSAYVDTVTGSVQLPTISSLTNKVDSSKITAARIVTEAGGEDVTYKVISPFSNAVDGLSNTSWAIEVETQAPKEVIARVRIILGGGRGATRGPASIISRVDFEPYGMRPVQAFVRVKPAISEDKSRDRSPSVVAFGGAIKTSAYNMTFVDEPREVSEVLLVLRKDTPDYIIRRGGRERYKYVFGAKDITIAEQVYDNAATLVTYPLAIAEELREDNVIDAVALTAEADVPKGANIRYYVAPDVEDQAAGIGDYDWKEVVPIDDVTDTSNNIVRMEGALSFAKNIKANPNPGDMQLIPINPLAAKETDKNPVQTIIPGVDVYKITEFADDDFIPGSVQLEEGVNSTRIFYIDRVADAWKTLAFWKPYIDGTTAATQVYGRTDTGNDFFYGGDIGEDGVSAYVETYLESTSNQPVMLKTVRKPDVHSRLWDVKIFLNGREIAKMPAGVNELTVPWRFQQGLNHIAMLVNIPDSSVAFPTPEGGTLDLMGDANLQDYGAVRLARWNYVDLFKMRYNEVGSPNTFTIHDRYIVSRRQPTANLRVKYSKASNNSPEAVRLRVDFSRRSMTTHVTPALHSYRLRFLYA